MKKLIAVAAFFLCGFAYASCPTLYPDNKEIAVPDTVELCNSFYVSRYNKNHKAVVLVSELLLKDSDVGKVNRVNSFKPDIRVGMRSAMNSDYTGSGYDKGHMAPAGNAASATQMEHSFFLTNMTPQEPTLNRNAWRMLEESVRDRFYKEQTDFRVVTIAMYNKPTRIGRDIPVPSGYWKFVIHSGKTDAYYADNKPNAKVQAYPAIDMHKIIANAQRW